MERIAARDRITILVAMMKEFSRKLSWQEIAEMERRDELYELASEFRKAFGVGLAFTFGVAEIQIAAYTSRRWRKIFPLGLPLESLAAIWRFFKLKTATGYHLTINRRPVGVYLYPSAELFRQNYSRGAAIVPSVGLAGTVDHRGFTDVIFYVLPAEYDQFCQDAHQVFTEYYCDGLCFYMIPDFWFNDMALVQFIRDKMRPHPAMRWWLNPPRSLVFRGIEHYRWFSLKPDY